MIQIISVKQPKSKFFRKFRILKDELTIRATQDCKRVFQHQTCFMKKNEVLTIKMRNHNLIPTDGPDNVEFARVCTPKTKNQFFFKLN